MQVEQFDDFVLVKAPPDRFDEMELRACVESLNKLASGGVTSIYLDLANAKILIEASVDFLSFQIGALKSKYKLEILLLCDPELAAQLSKSPLAQLLQIFERRDNKPRRIANRRIIVETESELHSRLQATMDEAIQTALKRWIGRPPNQIGRSSATVNPATDVVSVVTMNIDGCLFRVFLSGSTNTMRGMVEQVLNHKISDSDPAILDGACELLNYLTAFFKQRLNNENSIVETAAPQLLQPEEMMVILDRDLPAQRVQTDHGTFDVWFEAAA